MESIPAETVFTGPAATVLGLEALRSTKDAHTVALDIGGTTTDISLWKQGKPLMTKEGVSIREYPSAVRSFAVTSVGIGGECGVRYEDGKLMVGPERIGPSVALGGTIPTLGDASSCLVTRIMAMNRRRTMPLHRLIQPLMQKLWLNAS